MARGHVVLPWSFGDAVGDRAERRYSVCGNPRNTVAGSDAGVYSVRRQCCRRRIAEI